jgi:hypothetical protein
MDNAAGKFHPCIVLAIDHRARGVNTSRSAA